MERKESERERGRESPHCRSSQPGPWAGPGIMGDTATSPGRHQSLMRRPFLSRTHRCRALHAGGGSPGGHGARAGRETALPQAAVAAGRCPSFSRCEHGPLGTQQKRRDHQTNKREKVTWRWKRRNHRTRCSKTPNPTQASEVTPANGFSVHGNARCDHVAGHRAQQGVRRAPWCGRGPPTQPGAGSSTSPASGRPCSRRTSRRA